MTARAPRNTIGRPGRRPASLPAAISEPENVTAPMSDVQRRRGTRRPARRGRPTTRCADGVVDGDQRGRAAADRVEQADQLRHGGHLRPAGGVRGRPIAADGDAGGQDDPAGGGDRCRVDGRAGRRSATTAAAMPAAESGCRAGRCAGSSSGAGRARSRRRRPGSARRTAVSNALMPLPPSSAAPAAMRCGTSASIRSVTT